MAAWQFDAFPAGCRLHSLPGDGHDRSVLREQRNAVVLRGILGREPRTLRQYVQERANRGHKVA